MQTESSPDPRYTTLEISSVSRMLHGMGEPWHQLYHIISLSIAARATPPLKALQTCSTADSGTVTPVATDRPEPDGVDDALSVPRRPRVAVADSNRDVIGAGRDAAPWNWAVKRLRGFA